MGLMEAYMDHQAQDCQGRLRISCTTLSSVSEDKAALEEP